MSALPKLDNLIGFARDVSTVTKTITALVPQKDLPEVKPTALGVKQPLKSINNIPEVTEEAIDAL